MLPSIIKVMLVEDHPEYRMSLEIALSKEGDIDLIGQFGTVKQALRTINDLDDENIPNILLLDLNLPDIQGIDAIPEFLATMPSCAIIILTQSDTKKDVLASVQVGVSGYLLKSSTRHDIVNAIRQAHRGEATIDSKVTNFVLSALKEKKHIKPINLQIELTTRELQVLRLLGEGKVQKQISDELKISSHTVNNHIRHIYKKMHVQNAPEAIAKAYRSGLLHS